ncbi:hypothetical protein ANCCAN_00883 [Ancylostoma caninum]|uniref:Uncharacterized protein n=1 Tax=Ancylostoma caninum TaxID=29170 RepID=A0A368HB17_ANCCA|nr:hypothetical protein ANCCAN_00883 [Ancylostoma caninum]
MNAAKFNTVHGPWRSENLAQNGEDHCSDSNTITFQDVELPKLATAKCQPIPDGSRALYKVAHFVRPWANCERYTVSKIKDVASVEEL